LLEIASYKLGAVAIPLFTLFGTDALEYRLSNSEAKGIVTDAANLPKIMECAYPVDSGSRASGFR
jgi:acetyl-CoA synthetase